MKIKKSKHELTHRVTWAAQAVSTKSKKAKALIAATQNTKAIVNNFFSLILSKPV